MDFCDLFDSCPQLMWVSESPVFVDGFTVLSSLLKIFQVMY